MKPHDWPRRTRHAEQMPPEIDYLHDALQQPPGERDAFIERRHGADPELVLRLLRLLRAHERAELIESDRPAVPHSLVAAAIDPVPDRIGPYRVLERLAEGGMGVVYAAEQTEPLRRRVAIKVIKLGMDTREVLARFEAERQALAMMDHPGVAKVLDAGVTEQGRPYFVMELVNGISLIDYCRKHLVPLRKRLQLLTDVCSAVQHAHQKGIIHRDLKPSNILVAVKEGQAMPKVIDFGVAKATAMQLTERTFFTQQGRLIGTPEYMSPEQAEMSALDVDTRTDVYSLGVILYQLLTGVLPFDSKELRSGGYSQILRTIREVQPQRPSSRLMELSRQAAAPNEPVAHARAVRGELDWIVMRAIDKDRTRRYRTAAALGDDLERYLGDRPVNARPPSFAYSVRKFVQRHRYVTALMTLVLLSLVVGITGLLTGLLRAREAEALAMRRADNAQAAASFLERMMFQADPEFGGGSPSLLEVMERASRLIENDLRPFPEVEAAVRESIGVAYRRRSMFVEAAPHLWQSLEIRRRLLGDDDLGTARSYVALASLRLEYEGNIAAARELFDRAASCYRLHGLVGTTAEAWLQLDVGFADLVGDRLAHAARAFETSRKLLVAARGAEHPDVSRPVRGLAMVAMVGGRLDDAERLARHAVALSTGAGAAYIGARAKLVLAQALLQKGSLGEIDGLVTEADEQFRRTVGNQHIRIAECDAVRCEAGLRRGDFVDAMAAATRCEEMRRAMLYEDHWEILEARLLQQRARIGDGTDLDRDGAAMVEAELIEIEANAVRRLGPDHPLTIEIVAARADCAAAVGDATARTSHEQRLTALREQRSARQD